jgi:hypothetical protein
MISAVIRFVDSTISIHNAETEYVDKYFRKGFYSAITDSNGNIHITEEKLEELHYPYHTEDNDLVIKTVEAFFRKGVGDDVRKLGFTHKLGILLWGRAGTGEQV